MMIELITLVMLSCLVVIQAIVLRIAFDRLRMSNFYIFATSFSLSVTLLLFVVTFNHILGSMQ